MRFARGLQTGYTGLHVARAEIIPAPSSVARRKFEFDFWSESVGFTPNQLEQVRVPGSACVSRAVFGFLPDTSLSGREGRDAPPGNRDGRAPWTISPSNKTSFPFPRIIPNNAE